MVISPFIIGLPFQNALECIIYIMAFVIRFNLIQINPPYSFQLSQHKLMFRVRVKLCVLSLAWFLNGSSVEIDICIIKMKLRRLQLVQNSLCRAVTRSSKFSHITPQLKKLHWLPVRYGVQFKIGLITYKILNQGTPVYLRELIHPYTSFRNTRRSTPKLKFLHTPTFERRVHKSIKHFSISFSHYAPVLWNSLPFQIRNSPSVASFRKHLKTHLFNPSFPT